MFAAVVVAPAVVSDYINSIIIMIYNSIIKTHGLAFSIVKLCIPAAVVPSSVIAEVGFPLTSVPCNNNKSINVSINIKTIQLILLL